MHNDRACHGMRQAAQGHQRRNTTKQRDAAQAHRDSLVAGSITTVALSISPYFANNARKSASLVRKARLATYTLVPELAPSCSKRRRCKGTSGQRGRGGAVARQAGGASTGKQHRGMKSSAGTAESGRQAVEKPGQRRQGGAGRREDAATAANGLMAGIHEAVRPTER